MSPPKVDCPAVECQQDDRIDVLEESIGALTRESSETTKALKLVVERIGHQADSIAGKEGEGIVGAVEQLTAQFSAFRLQQVKEAEAIRLQQAKDMAAIQSEIAAMRAEYQARREAPGKTVRWIITILPLVAATIAAINWAVNHLRVMP